MPNMAVFGKLWARRPRAGAPSPGGGPHPPGTAAPRLRPPRAVSAAAACPEVDSRPSLLWGRPLMNSGSWSRPRSCHQMGRASADRLSLHGVHRLCRVQGTSCLAATTACAVSVSSDEPGFRPDRDPHREQRRRKGPGPLVNDEHPALRFSLPLAERPLLAAGRRAARPGLRPNGRPGLTGT